MWNIKRKPFQKKNNFTTSQQPPNDRSDMKNFWSRIFTDPQPKISENKDDEQTAPPVFVNTYLDLIHSSNLLTDAFGQWPSFHDSEILSIKAERTAGIGPGNVQIEMSVYLIDWKYVFKDMELRKDCLVTFQFFHCSDIHFDQFNQQNQLGALLFTVEKQVMKERYIPETAVVVADKEKVFIVPDEILVVTLEPEFGLGGGFKCANGAVKETRFCPYGEISFHME
jgi:hypothetical protein